jgi:hypothetical protein
VLTSDHNFDRSLPLTTIPFAQVHTRQLAMAEGRAYGAFVDRSDRGSQVYRYVSGVLSWVSMWAVNRERESVMCAVRRHPGWWRLSSPLSWRNSQFTRLLVADGQVSQHVHE